MSSQPDLGSEAPIPSEQQVQERIHRMLRDRLRIEIADPHLDLFEAGIIDSLGLVELLLGLEAEFGVANGTDDLDIENFKSLERVTAYVIERGGGSIAW